jgi:hypothetical protein
MADVKSMREAPKAPVAVTFSAKSVIPFRGGQNELRIDCGGAAMKMPHEYRPLDWREISLVNQVFYATVGDVSQIILNDGSGDRDAPFTIRSSLGIPGFSLPGKYMIFVGDAFKQNLSSKHRVPGEKYSYAELLVHEVTHVWQYEHGYNVVVNSLTHRAFEGDAMYNYDESNFLAWNDYNVEQQAMIVEHWYHNGMKHYDQSTGDGDIRYVYVDQNIRNERLDTFAPLPPVYRLDMTRPDTPRPEAKGKLEDPFAQIMAPRYKPGDAASIARVETLRLYFMQTRNPRELLGRITARRPDDKAVQDFFHVLHPATIESLLKILKSRAIPVR